MRQGNSQVQWVRKYFCRSEQLTADQCGPPKFKINPLMPTVAIYVEL